MDPFSAAAWGSRSVASRMSFWAGVQLTSVLAPGLVVGAEVSLLVFRYSVDESGRTLASLTESLPDVRGGLLVVVSLVAVSIGYVAGWVARELGFWLARRFAPLGRRRHRWRRRVPRPIPPAALAGPDTPPPSLAGRPVVEQVRAMLGDEPVDECARLHPILRVVERHAEAEGATQADEALLDHLEHQAFLYSKMWLRRFAPDLAVDRIEADVNILAAAVLPVVLLTANLVAWSAEPAVMAAVALPPTAAVVVLLVSRIVLARRHEPWEAVRNLVADHMMRTAMAAYPAVAIAASGAESESEG